MKSNSALRVHECGEVDAGGCQLLHDGLHVKRSVVIGAVLADRDIEEVVVSDHFAEGGKMVLSF